MNLKTTFLLLSFFVVISNSNAQKSWCDTIKGSNPGYSIAYTSPDKFSIMYDESRIGIHRDYKSYRLILKQQVSGKSTFVIVDNGKVIKTTATLTNEDIIGGARQPLDGLRSITSKTGYEKYLIADSTSTTMAAQKSTTVTAPQSINTKQVSSALEMMKNTDEYKKMSAEEKKDLEDAMKMMPQASAEYANSGLAGKTVSTPEIKSATYTVANGFYNVIIKGKNYGRFMGRPQIQISPDESNVYIVGADSTYQTNFFSNGKSISLDGKGKPPLGHSGVLIMSADGKKAAFVEIQQMNEKEQEEMLKKMQNGGLPTQTFSITKNDGSSQLLTRTDGGDEFKLTNSGSLLYINNQTGEVFTDGKKTGKFNITNGGFNTAALLSGTDASKLCYYNEDGSLSFMDGSRLDMGIVFPQAFSENGKTYISWFRKCNNVIYIGKYEF